jgi:hypothetical protein
MSKVTQFKVKFNFLNHTVVETKKPYMKKMCKKSQRRMMDFEIEKKQKADFDRVHDRGY